MSKELVLLVVGTVALSCSAVAQAQDEQEVVRNQEPDVEDVIMTPIDDLNLDDDEIPEILVAASIDPYASPAGKDCESLRLAIADLDAVLGPDYDIVNDGTDPFSEGRVAKRVVGSFIPFRGILREITGAAGEKRELQAAIVAGLARRAYLKGLGEASECPYPSRPAFMAIEIDEDDVVKLQPVTEE
ncbi:hypothetical protein [Altererythrobacter lutimaris]|uniref:Uncharacterized protein n=1 Tax=Altererythrobacter lutimaris TaxID=2743979 RepID=A0A850HBF0_9SPHN|nr:hypothetical protein [Altererythrobacter lutimaris]NVE93878.1 hypothetical protein [Altererythrobacter lutimaris]